jgi:hypothetical protein
MLVLRSVTGLGGINAAKAGADSSMNSQRVALGVGVFSSLPCIRFTAMRPRFWYTGKSVTKPRTHKVPTQGHSILRLMFYQIFHYQRYQGDKRRDKR